ncbi:MAG: glycosyltransferase family 2 protein [Nitrospinae bacterium]|nr:glycosyltransferase family 2 protein [Nitrospinota bacterium]
MPANTSPKISAAIITHNEEAKISDCLKSLSWVDEIVLMDSHSSDKTREIAATFPKIKIIERAWEGHVRQKNHAMSATAHDWVISLDADERVSARLREEILEVMKNPTADGYSMPRKVFYINRWINHCGWYPAPKVRLVKKALAKWEGVDPHDSLKVDGRVEKLSGDLYHLSFENIYGHFRTIDNFTRIGAQEAFKAGKRANILDITLRPLFTFVKMYLIKLGFLDGIPGLIICVLSAFHTFTKYDRLYTLQSEPKK